MASAARPYRPLRVDSILPRVELRKANGETFAMPSWRLNLMVCKNDILYLVGPDDSPAVVAYAILRGGKSPLSLSVLGEYTLAEQELHPNNAALFTSSTGSQSLLVTGGNPGEQGPNGKLVVFGLPNAGEESCRRQGTLLLLPLKSTWGLDVAADGSDTIAVSSNSHVVSVFRLTFSEDAEVGISRPNLEALHHLRGHMGNVPCVTFGPGVEDGSKQLLYSASIDSTFCVFDFATGRRLYQDSQAHDHDFHGLIVKDWCWSVLALACPPASHAIKPVYERDAVWSSLENGNSRKRHWLNSMKLESRLNASLEKHEKRTCEARPGPQRVSVVAPLPVYDDCCHVEENYSRRVGVMPGVGPDVTVSSQQVGPSWDVDGLNQPKVVLEVPDGDEEGQLVVVGRLDTVHLYRLSCPPGVFGGMRGQMLATELQSLRPQAPTDSDSEDFDGHPISRISQIIQLEELGALLVVQQGGGVSIIRLVSNVPANAPAANRGSLKRNVYMVLEMQLNIDWRPIVGLCVNKRDGGWGLDDVHYEVFIAQAKGAERATIRSFELSPNCDGLRSVQTV